MPLPIPPAYHGHLVAPQDFLALSFSASALLFRGRPKPILTVSVDGGAAPYFVFGEPDDLAYFPASDLLTYVARNETSFAGTPPTPTPPNALPPPLPLSSLPLYAFEQYALTSLALGMDRFELAARLGSAEKVDAVLARAAAAGVTLAWEVPDMLREATEARERLLSASGAFPLPPILPYMAKPLSKKPLSEKPLTVSSLETTDPANQTSPTREYVGWPFKRMRVRERVRIPGHEAKKARAAAYMLAMRRGWKFTTEQLPGTEDVVITREA